MTKKEETFIKSFIALFTVLSFLSLGIMLTYQPTLSLVFILGSCLGLIVSVKLDAALKGLNVIDHAFNYKNKIMKKADISGNTDLSDLSYIEVSIQNYVFHTYKKLSLEQQLLMAGQIIYMCKRDTDLNPHFPVALHYDQPWAVAKFQEYYSDSMRGVRASKWYISIVEKIQSWRS